MISLRPLAGLMRKGLRLGLRGLPDVAVEAWPLAPGDSSPVPPALCLPGQSARIGITAFGSHQDVLTSFAGGFEAVHAPTMAYRVAQADLVDGVLYAPGAERYLQPKARRRLVYQRPETVAGGVIYESWTGNGWFGNWLCDDGLSYRLAEGLGDPVTSAPPGIGHMPAYAARLGIAPRRLTRAHFDEVIVIDDLSNNAGKTLRAIDMRARLLAGLDSPALPGVFLLRGTTGVLRGMENEREIAEMLAARHGFVVLDPAQATVSQIAALCGNAGVVAGVEGSHLAHGVAVLAPKAALLTIQPPDRVCAVLKTMLDRQGQTFAYLVAARTATAFRADPDEVLRTLDLITG